MLRLFSCPRAGLVLIAADPGPLYAEFLTAGVAAVLEGQLAARCPGCPHAKHVIGDFQLPVAGAGLVW